MLTLLESPISRPGKNVLAFLTSKLSRSITGPPRGTMVRIGTSNRTVSVKIRLIEALDSGSEPRIEMSLRINAKRLPYFFQ